MIEAITAAAMSIFCSDTKPPSILRSMAPLRQVELVGDHHLGLAAEHEFAEADQEIGEPERRHEQDDVGLVDQRPQHQALDPDRRAPNITPMVSAERPRSAGTPMLVQARPA